MHIMTPAGTFTNKAKEVMMAIFGKSLERLSNRETINFGILLNWFLGNFSKILVATVNQRDR